MRRAVVAIVVVVGCEAAFDSVGVGVLHRAMCDRRLECGDDGYCTEFTSTGTEGTPDCVVREGEDTQPCLDAIAGIDCELLVDGGYYRPLECGQVCAD